MTLTLSVNLSCIRRRCNPLPQPFASIGMPTTNIVDMLELDSTPFSVPTRSDPEDVSSAHLSTHLFCDGVKTVT